MSYCLILNILCHVLVIIIMCLTYQDEMLISGLVFVVFVSRYVRTFSYILDPIFIWKAQFAEAGESPVCRFTPFDDLL